MLSDNDRKYILNALRAAPDHVLADAMLAYNAFRDKVIAVRKLTKAPEAEPSSPEVEDTPSSEVEDTPDRPNVDPGKSTIIKIGAKSKDEIFVRLKNGASLDRFSEHLKLLWSRGEVKFDGTRYYV